MLTIFSAWCQTPYQSLIYHQLRMWYCLILEMLWFFLKQDNKHQLWVALRMNIDDNKTLYSCGGGEAEWRQNKSIFLTFSFWVLLIIRWQSWTVLKQNWPIIWSINSLKNTVVWDQRSVENYSRDHLYLAEWRETPQWKNNHGKGQIRDALKKKKNQTHLNMANLSYFSFENMCHRKEYLHRTPLKKIVFRFIYICICLRYKKKHIVCSQRQNFRQQLHVASDFWKFANISFIATETEKLPKKMINQFVQ